MMELDLPILDGTVAAIAVADSQPEPCRFEPPNPGRPRLRAALVNPPDGTSADGYRWTPPLGLGYVASFARLRGFHADVFDLSLESAPIDELIDVAGLLDAYDVYGFSTYTETFAGTIEFVRAIARRRPEAVIVLGGYHASVAAEPILRDFPEVGLIVLKEGEEAFAAILDRIAGGRDLAGIAGIAYRDERGAIVTVPASEELIDQEHLPYPVQSLRYGPTRALHLPDPTSGLLRKTMSIVSSRGCPKRCTFCSIIILSPTWRARSVESLMEEIEYRYRQSPFDHIIFQDANFFVGTARTLELARALHAFNPAITWSGTATADQVGRHADVLREIGSLNCWYLELGIESGNDNSLRRFNKRTTVAINERALRLLAESDIEIGLDFIMFEPEMTLDDVVDNVRFLYRNELFGYWPAEHLFSDLRLFPGTVFRDRHLAAAGIADDVHIIPDPVYRDPAVGALVKAMHTYLALYQATTNRAIKSMLALSNYLLFDTAEAVRGRASLVDRLQRLQGMLVRLRHLPYTFLGCLLMRPDALASGESFEALTAGIDLGAELELHAECRALARDIVEDCERTGLEIPPDVREKLALYRAGRSAGRSDTTVTIAA